MSTEESRADEGGGDRRGNRFRANTVGLAEAIAHDLNNLLTAVSGCTEQLELVLPRDDPARRDTNDIHEAIGDASILVRLINPGATVAESVSEDLNLASLMRVAINLIRKQLPRSIDVVLEHVNPKLTARGDAVIVLQILLELAAIVSQRMDATGTIVFAIAGAEDERTIKVVGSPSLEGVDEELPSKLLSRAQSTGGALQGQRCQWNFTLPASSASKPPGTCESLGLKQVLIAEPDGHLRSFFVSALKAQDPVHVEDASQLTQLLDERGAELDLALIAINLRDLDPITAYVSIRKRLPKLALVLFSEHSAVVNQLNVLIDEDEKAVLLTKPFGVSELISSITKIVSIE